jgi:hypothetical protein
MLTKKDQQFLLEHFATKDDLKDFAKKDDLKDLAKQKDLLNTQRYVIAMQNDLNNVKEDMNTIKEDLGTVKQDVHLVKQDMKGVAKQKDLLELMSLVSAIFGWMDDIHRAFVGKPIKRPAEN